MASAGLLCAEASVGRSVVGEGVAGGGVKKLPLLSLALRKAPCLSGGDTSSQGQDLPGVRLDTGIASYGPCWNRTNNLGLKRPLLCQLS